MIWEIWWAWVAAGFLIAIFELFAPGYLFAGFAIGAVVTGLVLLGGVWPAGWMAGSLGNHLLVFSIISVIVWLAMRRVLGLRRGQVKTFDRDINED